MRIDGRDSSAPDPAVSGRKKCLRGIEVAKRLFKGSSKGAFPLIEQYRPEAIDLKHRYAVHIHPFWEVWKKVATISDSFNEWLGKLENGEEPEGYQELVSTLKNKEPIADQLRTFSTVHYLSDVERGQYALKIDKDGRLFTDNLGPLKDSNKQKEKYIFVVGLDDTIYVAIRRTGYFQHSSFFGGSPVKGAGELDIENGFLNKLSDKTGHYQAWRYPEMTANSIRAFTKLGIHPRTYQVVRNDGLDPRLKKEKEVYRSADQFLRQFKP